MWTDGQYDEARQRVEPGAARGNGGAAGRVPAAMRGFKVQKCLAVPYRARRAKDRDFHLGSWIEVIPK